MIKCLISLKESIFGRKIEKELSEKIYIMNELWDKKGPFEMPYNLMYDKLKWLYTYLNLQEISADEFIKSGYVPTMIEEKYRESKSYSRRQNRVYFSCIYLCDYIKGDRDLREAYFQMIDFIEDYRSNIDEPLNEIEKAGIKVIVEKMMSIIDTNKLLKK